MRVSIDEMLCEGHALCQGVAPDIFQVGDDDMARVLIPEPSEDRHDDVRKAAMSCPKQAIVVSE